MYRQSPSLGLGRAVEVISPKRARGPAVFEISVLYDSVRGARGHIWTISRSSKYSCALLFVKTAQGYLPGIPRTLQRFIFSCAALLARIAAYL